MPAVVLIETTSGRGSGFFVRHDTLITNVHVVQNDGYVTLRRMDGSTVNARVESRAPAFDIAVLKVATPSASQAVIPMGSAHSLKPGQEIIVIGSALGTLQNSVSRGIVSGLRSSGGATLVQTDAATNPGNSGGPMLDRNGAVIGITTMGYRNAQGLNFGVAIDHARDLLEGRQANLGSQGGLTDIQSQSRGSESDRRQQQGEEQLRQQIGQMAEAAGRIDSGWKRFRDQCLQVADPRPLRSRMVRAARAARHPRRCGRGLHELLRGNGERRQAVPRPDAAHRWAMRVAPTFCRAPSAICFEQTASTSSGSDENQPGGIQVDGLWSNKPCPINVAPCCVSVPHSC